MVKELERTVSSSMINKDKIYVDPSSEHKMHWLQKALSEGKIFVLTKTALKKNIGFKGDNAILSQMYLFREEATAYAELNGIDIDVFEKYEDDTFAYEAQLIIRKKTNNI